MFNLYDELGESSRRQILSELRHGPRSVTELVQSTGLKQPNVSNHLARLRLKGVVKAHKVGRQVFYSLSSAEVEAIVESLFQAQGGEQPPVDLDSLSKSYAKAAINGDETACLEIMDTALRARVPMLELYQDMLAPAMAMIGMWYKVEAIDEAQEHMASEITERMMARTVQMSSYTRRLNRTAILGCAPNSYHVIGLRMISDFLRLNGWKTLFLGANVPIASYVAAVKQHRPNLILLSCASSEGVDDTVSLISRLAGMRSRKQPFLIGVGGHAVEQEPARFSAAGADFSARDLRSFAEELLPEIEKHGTVPGSLRPLTHSNGHDESGNVRV